MSQERLSMKKLRDVLRLHYECNLSNRKISRALKISATTVGHYIKAAHAANLVWSTSNHLKDSALVALLEPFSLHLTKTRHQFAPFDCASMHRELKKKGVTRELLHQEYLKNCGDQKPFSYGQFCRQLRAFGKTLKPSMRQSHIAGEKTFVDYAGPTVPIIDGETGEVHQARIFVFVFGASNYTYAEAAMTRSLPDWISSHVRMFEYFGGVTELIIPDNEKAAVNKACQYDPDVNPNYTALAAHYGTAVLPTRPYKPQDKSKVEVGVLVVERWILARLRHQTFFSLRELNAAIAKLLVDLNNKPFKKMAGTRRSHFEELEKQALKPLPAQPYEYVTIKNSQVKLDYHVEIDQHHYSVPHQLIGKKIEYHLSESSVAIFYDGKRVASHIRSHKAEAVTTVPEHMPKAHLKHQKWTPGSFKSWANEVGPSMSKTADYLIKNEPHPECCYRIHLGFKNMEKCFGKQRLEEACCYALQYHLLSFNQIKSVLQTQVDKAPMLAANDRETQELTYDTPHDNVRGADYYS